jgi:hypothetical protein
VIGAAKIAETAPSKSETVPISITAGGTKTMNVTAEQFGILQIND